jgi:hypothetical protein
MSSRLGKTKTQRDCKTRKFGNKSKRRKENHGTTASFPLTGPIPSLRFGVPISASEIIVSKADLAPKKA